MHEDLVRGYRNFLLGSIKVYFLGHDIIQDEINFHTNSDLKDGLAFFLLAFEKNDAKLITHLKIKDINSLQKYLTISKNACILTENGAKLKEYLEEKLLTHAAMLEFNGIKPQYLGKVNTMLKRFEKFWKTIINFSRKAQLGNE